MRSSRIMEVFCKDASNASWTPQNANPNTPPQKLKKKHHYRFSLTKSSSASSSPPPFSEDTIPTANPRRLPRAPILEEDYRRAQGHGPISTNPKDPRYDRKAPMPIFPTDQFTIPESSSSNRRRSWTLHPRNATVPVKPALVTISEFEEHERPRSTYAPYSPKPPPTPPKDTPVSPKPISPKTTPAQARPTSTRIFRVNSRGTAVKRVSSKNGYAPKEKVLSIGTGRPKLVEIIPAGRRRSRAVSHVISTTKVLQEIAVNSVDIAELPAVSSPREKKKEEVSGVKRISQVPDRRASVVPEVVVNAGPVSPKLTLTAPTPSTTPAPTSTTTPAPTPAAVSIPMPTRPAPPPPTTDNPIYKPYRPAAPSPPLTTIPRHATGWPDWNKVTDTVEEEEKEDELSPVKVVAPLAVKKAEVPEALKIRNRSSTIPVDVPEALRIQDWSKTMEMDAKRTVSVPVPIKKEQKVAVPEAKMVVSVPAPVPGARRMIIPEALRIGMGSSSLEQRLGSWEVAVGGKY